MSGLFIFGVIFLAVVCMVIAISKFNMHPFLVLTVIAILVGLVCGIPAGEVIDTVKSGFGNILASIGIVILCGTIIGTILEKTGAALTMANSILKIVGKDRSVLTMGITGYITGIPVFCDSGFVILSPILKALGFHRRFCEILVIFDVKASVHNNSSPRWMRFTEGSCLYSFF